jgi:hypothetical protein
MVGRRREQARPTIIVHCRSKTCCRNKSHDDTAHLPAHHQGVHISHILFCKALFASEKFVSGGDISSLSDIVCFISRKRCIMKLPRCEHIFNILIFQYLRGFDTIKTPTQASVKPYNSVSVVICERSMVLVVTP